MAAVKNKKYVKKSKKEVPKADLKEKIVEMLELPKEIALNMPKITMVGLSNLILENYKGIVEYSDNRLRINTGTGIIKITGARLLIKEITSEDVMIEGEITALEFIK